MRRRVLVFCFALLGCASSQPAPPAPSTQEPEPAALPGVVDRDGKTVDVLEDAEGAPTLLAFTTPWEYSRECARVQAWVQARATVARALLVVTECDAQRLGECQATSLGSYADAEGNLAARLGVSRTPTYVLVESEGRRVGSWGRLESVPLAEAERGMRRPVVDSGKELGTSYEVVVFTDRPEAEVRADLRAARERCRALEHILSEWRPDSEVSRLNAANGRGPIKVHEDLRRLLAASLEVTRATSGAFDVTWFCLAELWNAAARDDAPPKPAEIELALTLLGPDKVTIGADTVALADGTRVGLGAVAKGWIVDAVFLLLRGRGYKDLIVNIGGDLRAGGRTLQGGAHVLRIRDPFNEDGVAGELLVTDQAAATSGNLFKQRTIGGKAYGHLIDPRSGWPARFEGSVTVVTRDAAMADAMATALFVLGPADGLALARETAGLEVVYVTRDGIQSSIPLEGGALRRLPDPAAGAASAGEEPAGAR